MNWYNLWNWLEYKQELMHEQIITWIIHNWQAAVLLVILAVILFIVASVIMGE